MTIEELIAHYPRAFHMAEHGSWDSICARGLLSTSALLDLFEITGERRFRLESMRRDESEPITHPLYGSAIIRDQKVLSDSALLKCLSGAAPRQWYEMLNGKTFFWLHPHRLVRLLRGRAYRNRCHSVITVDTAELVKRHRKEISLSPINSGSTIFNPAPRSPATFYTIQDFPFLQRETRQLENNVVELAVNYSVPDIGDVAISVDTWKGPICIETIWRRTEDTA